MPVDILVFADYSGAQKKYLQKRHIVQAVQHVAEGETVVNRGITRAQLREHLIDLLINATKQNKTVLMGLDHNYAFPGGFITALTGKKIVTWRRMLTQISLEEGIFGSFSRDPIGWAAEANHIIRRKYKIPAGPFWGPAFIAKKKPAIDFSRLPFAEKRLVEQIYPRMKTVFQLGGIGSVGLQSLYGIGNLARLVTRCTDQDIPLHCWPYDGWHIPEDHHLLTEIYPGYYNSGKKSDLNDTVETIRWFQKKITAGKLNIEFEPNLPAYLKKTAQSEGWIPGIACRLHYSSK
jgi:hypothetical protein